METQIQSKGENVKRKLKWNFFRILFAGIVIVCIFWLIFGFIKKPDSAETQTYQGLLKSSPIISEKGVALTIDNTKINEDVWTYYLNRAAKNYATSVGVEISKIKWDEKNDEGDIPLEIVKYNAIKDIVRTFSVAAIAPKLGIELSEDDKNILTELDGLKELHGEKVYEVLGIKNKESFDIIRTNVILEEKVREKISGNPGDYTDGKKIEDYADNQSGTFKIIEIPKEDDDSAKEQIEAIKKRLDKREDFDKLWTEVMGEFYRKFLYEDRTTPEIMYMYRDSVAKSHEKMEASGLELNLGEISGVIETDYSYMILKRVEGYTEIANMITDECDVKLNREVLETTIIKSD